MNEKQRRSSRMTALSTAAFALIFFALLSTTKVHADPIAITGGFYTIDSPFRTIPRFISFTHDLQGMNFRAIAGEIDAPSQRLGSNCVLPCTAGSVFSLSASLRIGREAPTSLLEIGGQRRFGFFGGSLAQFDTQNVTIPLDVGAEFTLSTLFTMRGVINFQEYDPQRGSFTGFTFSSGIFGSGIVNISLFFSRTTNQYEV